MFKYYQTNNKSKWSIISDNENVEETAIGKGATKLTILSVSEDITPEVDSKSIKYKGPFYADIDMKNDLSKAALSCKNLVDSLTKKQVSLESIEIFASGSKGFHVIVPPTVFSTGRPLKSLPSIYKEMALALYVPGMDLQVYCGGKGNSWKIENVQREDGNYRVRISYEEVLEIIEDPNVYKSLVKAPRAFPQSEGRPERSSELEALFAACKMQANRAPSTTSVIESAELKKHFASELPACVLDLRDGKIKNNTNYNQASLNLASFVARSGRSQQDMASLSLRMAENTTSSAYDTIDKRVNHSEGVYKYVSSSSKYNFSCAAMRSCIAGNPCDGCSLSTEDKKEVEDANLGVKVSEGCYYRVSASGGATLISTFVLVPSHKVTGANEDNEQLMELKGVVCDVITRTGVKCQRLFTEQCWKSKSSFLNAIAGVEGATFFGSDTDIQKLKFYIFNEQEEMEEVTEVSRAGILIEDFKGFPLPVYVEPGMSLNKFGTQGTHIVKRHIPLPPKISKILLGPDLLKEACAALELLFKINRPEVIGVIIGWFCATHLKSHLMHAHSQFPLLHLWGNAGSGKTRTAEMFMWLTGCANEYSSLSLSLPHSTKFPIVNYVTSTTTVPRILEEFNKSKLGPREYNNIHEVLKSAFNQHTVSRGALGNAQTTTSGVSAKSVELEVTSPILYISEQPVDSPPLRQRSLSICLESKGRRAGTKAWNQLQNNCKRLEVISKLLCLAAIKTTVEEVKQKLKECEIDNPKLEDRAKYGLEVTDMGVKFLREVLVSAGAPDSTIIALDDMREESKQGFDHLLFELTEQTSRTEIDWVLDDMALMAYLDTTNTVQGLQRGTHFMIKGNSLFLDLPVAHGLYMRVKKQDAVVQSYSQMIKLIRNEDYCISDQSACPEMGVSRKVVELDLEKMTSKGIETSLFY